MESSKKKKSNEGRRNQGLIDFSLLIHTVRGGVDQCVNFSAGISTASHSPVGNLFHKDADETFWWYWDEGGRERLGIFSD
jgi:hypothetical protein